MKRRSFLILTTGPLVASGFCAWWLWPRPAAVPAGMLVIGCEKGSIHLINPDGTGLRLVATYQPPYQVRAAKLSPNRKRLAYAVQSEEGDLKTIIRVKDVDSDTEFELATVLNLEYLFWSPDGGRLYGSNWSGESQSYVNWSMDLATGERTSLPVPKEYKAWGVTPDGGELLCVRPRQAGLDGVEVVRTGSGEFQPVVVIPEHLGLTPLALFPDGKKWVVRIGAGQFGTYVFGDQTATPWPWRCDSAYRAVVSPDGAQVVVNYRAVGGAFSNGHTKNIFHVGLTTYTPDGSAGRTVWEPEKVINKFDWR